MVATRPLKKVFRDTFSQNFSFYSHSVGAQPLPPSSLDQTQVWLAVNEDGLSVLDYTMVSVCGYFIVSESKTALKEYYGPFTT